MQIMTLQENIIKMLDTDTFTTEHYIALKDKIIHLTQMKLLVSFSFHQGLQYLAQSVFLFDIISLLYILSIHIQLFHFISQWINFRFLL